jgi:hypothetical protein
LLDFQVDCSLLDSRSQMRSNGAMDEAVARLNIEHYHKLLATETDQAKCQMLRRLLAEEEAKLAALTDAPKVKKLKL